ncbi:hypothetical protein LOK49_LG06G03349 [Camellia lanceoleosa]|uniref:Uncharacterized protein n=1 Tax=Camellia lanceoleosa TaxID=1840588 RepID=A0ACC0H8E3_9ERIC|nr:hypothetical protein LOK49_LG06G03349 [Camellia lanceoleosa]
MDCDLSTRSIGRCSRTFLRREALFVESLIRSLQSSFWDLVAGDLSEGRLPNTKRLNLEAVGVELDEMGALKVDEFSRTNVPSIWAVGNVTNRLNLTPMALMEGTCFSKTVFGGQPTKPDYSNVPCAVFCIPPLCVVGLSEEEAIEQAKGDISIFTSTFNPIKNTVLGRQEKTVMKLVVDSETDKVIGASMCGPDAPEIMQKESIINFVAPSAYPVITFGPFASPTDVLISLSHAVGTVFMPPKWSLGYHQCRWSYDSDTS